MTKTAVTRTWLGGVIGLAAGLVIVGISVGLMLAYAGHFTAAPSGNGYDFVPTYDGFFWTTIGFTVLGSVVAFAGGIVQLVAWVGAMVNTNRLVDKTWFTILLLGGLVGLIFAPIGFATMVAYVVGGPDGMAVPQGQPTSSVAPSRTLAPTS